MTFKYQIEMLGTKLKFGKNDRDQLYSLPKKKK